MEGGREGGREEGGREGGMEGGRDSVCLGEGVNISCMLAAA